MVSQRFDFLKYILLWVAAFALYYWLWDAGLVWYEYSQKAALPRHLLRQFYWVKGVASTLLLTLFALWLFNRLLRKKFRDVLRDQQAAVLEKFSAHVAHEIRNPLTSLSLNTELIQAQVNRGENQGPGDIEKLSLALSEDIHRLATTTEAYLNFRNKLPANKVFEIADVMEELISKFEANYHQEGHSIRFDKYLKRPSRISGDPGRFRVLVTQLIQNAVEAMPHGGVIHLNGSKHLNDYRLVVRDTGVGMSRDVYHHLFEPFFTTKLKGSGLGLALVRQILKEFQATIRCKTKLGQGSSFQIYFPLVK